MRLKHVSINEYKNLKDLEVDFSGDGFLDVFVGKNGSGKSNFLEALLEIFNHLYEFDPAELGPGFGYRLTIEIKGEQHVYHWAEGKLLDGDGKQMTPKDVELPDHVITYYSGQNGTMDLLGQAYVDRFLRKIRTAAFGDRRKIIQIGPNYKELLLAALLLQDEECAARRYLLQKLRIKSVGEELRLVLKRPRYARGSKPERFDVDADDQTAGRFWRAEGPTRQFLERLWSCRSDGPGGGAVRTEGYLSDDDEHIVYLSIPKFQEEFSTDNAEQRFHMFDNLLLIDMLKEISCSLEMEDGINGGVGHFSDGQFQSIYILAVTELFKNADCVTLLDEPDAFLHPEWQYEFLQQVLAVSDEAAQTNHVLMSSHSASTIASRVQSRIRQFDISTGVVQLKEPAKAAAIDALSCGMISFSDADAKISISDNLKDYDGSVLFTEGLTDQIILEKAWQKLNPGVTQPFAIQATFGCDFLRRLLLDEKFCAENSDRHLFGLFDFDEAYNQWNIKSNFSRHLQEDVSLGLVRQKLANDQITPLNVYFMLLPVPNPHPLRDQVVNPATGQHYKAESRFSIEMLFNGIEGTDEFYVPDTKRPRSQCLKFSESQKSRFATEKVPEFPAEAFEPFRPIFNFVLSKVEEYEQVVEGV
jgi:energy-coupling factor transporter ATP-binding protein EcfA2